MPVMANLGNINYVITLAVGSILAINGVGGSDPWCTGIFPAADEKL